MKRNFHTSLEADGLLMLLEDSLGSIPFNLVLAVLLGLELIYNHVPVHLVVFWLGVIFCISLSRWTNSKIVIKNKYYLTQTNITLSCFILLTCLMGLAWGSTYLFFLPYVNMTQETIIILVLGGMSAGAIASLSVCIPAYYAYVLPMFLPVVAYNLYTLNMDRLLLGVMYLLFVVMVFITAKINSLRLRTNFKLGKEKDVLIKEKDILINELTLMNLKLEKSIGKVKVMSITDSLTGLYNRRYFDLVFDIELKRAQREKYAINLVLIDIDNFKYINDTYGHPSGDKFLIYIANTLKNSMNRPNDSIFRLGGDEFALILGHMSPDRVLPFCSKVQERFNINNEYRNVTMSMGAVGVNVCSMMDVQAIVTIADQTLYQAKKDGKNLIVSKII